MKGHQERPRRSGIAAILLGLEVCAGLTKQIAAAFLGKSRSRISSGNTERAAEVQAEEQPEATAGAVLVVGGAVAWRLSRFLLHSLSRWLLSERHISSGPGTGDAVNASRAVEAQNSTANIPGNPVQPVNDCGCTQRSREADRNLDAERRVNLRRRERQGLALVVLVFAAALAGGLGFLVTYWTGGSNPLLGGMLALCFGGLGMCAVIWARWLTVHKEATEPREHASSIEDHEAASADFAEGAADIRRRRLLGGMAAGALAIMGAMVISLFRSLGLSPDAALYSYVWKRGQRLVTIDGNPVAADALPHGGTILVFPEDSVGSEKTQTVLVRVDPALLRLPEQRADWAPMGNLAYSRVCTHAGCSVGMYEATSHQLMCPCHQSTFDVLQGAAPSGGPAARPLPQLPLYTDKDGYLRAAGGFSEPPGPGFWGMPA